MDAEVQLRFGRAFEGSQGLKRAGDNDQRWPQTGLRIRPVRKSFRKATSNPTTGQDTPIVFTPIEPGDIDPAKNRFTTASGTAYNDNGQVVTDGKFRNLGYGYDANGRMVRASEANKPDALSVYDALGNRVAEKVNDVWQFVIYDAFGKLVAEYGGTAPQDEGGVRFYLQDWQGSVRAGLKCRGIC
ncbi:MAG: hypothetical protein IPK58_08435 [Acidobacteria bacterium]|nr:hypothetical protein [Acidobacteriota bacterium]